MSARRAGWVAALAWLLLASGPAERAYYITERGGSAGRDGANWKRARAAREVDERFWRKLTPGDVVYLGAGRYHVSWTVTAAGSPMRPVRIVKATEAAHGSSEGWAEMPREPSVFEHSTLVIDGDHLVFDGGEPGGLIIRVPPRDKASGIAFARPRSDVVLRNLTIEGPGTHDVHNTRGLDLTPSPGRSTRITVEHCDISNLANAIYTLNIDSVVVQHCRLHHINSEGPAHENAWYAEGCSWATFRYNVVGSTTAEGVFLRGDQQHWFVYGNVFVDAGYGVATKKGYAHTDVRVYNNTFVRTAIPVAFKDPRDRAIVKNNLFFPSAKGVMLASGVEHDFNWYGGSSALGEPGGVAGDGENPFEDGPEAAFVPAPRSSSRDMGVALPEPFARDPRGHARGADGGWDAGAFEAGDGWGVRGPRLVE